MEWLEQVRQRQKRGNQILFDRDSSCLHELRLVLEREDRRVVALWAFGFAAESVAALEACYPNELRPRRALEAAQAWAAGVIKMREAQRHILNCHAAAKELTRRSDVAVCHAVGQACSVVHTTRHAIGYPVYDLTSIVWREGLEQSAERVEGRIRAYWSSLEDCQNKAVSEQTVWAKFMCLNERLAEKR